MTRPTKFEVMRRNRRVLESAAEARAAEAAWAERRLELQADRAAAGQDSSAWIRETREEARRVEAGRVAAVAPRRRGWLRRCLNWSMGFEGSA